MIKDIRINHLQGDFLKSNYKIITRRKRLKSTNKVKFSKWFAYLNKLSAMVLGICKKKRKIEFLNPDVYLNPSIYFKYLRPSEQDLFSFLNISITREALFLWMTTFSPVNVDARQPTHARMNATGYQLKVQSWHKHFRETGNTEAQRMIYLVKHVEKSRDFRKIVENHKSVVSLSEKFSGYQLIGLDSVERIIVQ